MKTPERKAVHVTEAQVAHAVSALRSALDFIEKQVSKAVQEAKAAELERARKCSAMQSFRRPRELTELAACLLWSINLISKNYKDKMPSGIADAFPVLKAWGYASQEIPPSEKP